MDASTLLAVLENDHDRTQAELADMARAMSDRLARFAARVEQDMADGTGSLVNGIGELQEVVRFHALCGHYDSAKTALNAARKTVGLGGI